MNELRKCINCHDYIFSGWFLCQSCQRYYKRTGKERPVSFAEALQKWHIRERGLVRMERIEERFEQT